MAILYSSVCVYTHRHFRANGSSSWAILYSSGISGHLFKMSNPPTSIFENLLVLPMYHVALERKRKAETSEEELHHCIDIGTIDIEWYAWKSVEPSTLVSWGWCISSTRFVQPRVANTVSSTLWGTVLQLLDSHISQSDRGANREWDCHRQYVSVPRSTPKQVSARI